MSATDTPSLNVAEYISALAIKHGVSYVREANDDLANIITNLSGDGVCSDDIENLGLALI